MVLRSEDYPLDVEAFRLVDCVLRAIDDVLTIELINGSARDLWRSFQSTARIRADLGDADAQGRIRLDAPAAREGLTKFGIALQEGLMVTIWDDTGEAAAVLERSEEKGGIWVGRLRARG